MSMQGKVAVVTGAGQGLGRAIAVVLAEKGAAVAVWDLSAETAHSTAELIRAAGGTAVAIAGDVSDTSAVRASAERTRSELGHVSILVNNAGVMQNKEFIDLTDEEWERMLRINMGGPFRVTRELVPDMLASGWGRIVNISSSSAQTGTHDMAHYVASKGGVIGLTKALAREYVTRGITVNHVPPGFVDTPSLRAQIADVDAASAAMPMKRPGRPEDIAHAVAYLASEEAGYVTGQTLSVNGGRYLF